MKMRTRLTMARYGRGLSPLLLVTLTALLPFGTLASDCQVTLSRPVVDYGRMTPGEGQKALRGSLYALSENEVVASAYCTSPQKMALFFSGTPKDGGFLFGGSGLLGVEAAQATLDGKSVKLGKTPGQGVIALSGTAGDSAVVSNNDGLVPVINQTPQSGQRFSVVLTLKPLMNASGLKPADQTLLKSDLNIRVDTE
ncbi:hypothetical protein [Enterobacter hormaechei]|uniref:hypothetical protein n=2 Tax=Enterobacter hormaechei TaxID=158836 RepID=UPI002A75EA76|nr:hypothetical protein [Enterobacter hormaechei]MDY3572508.1 hypothetical protein [Enterobacter hormaechei]